MFDLQVFQEARRNPPAVIYTPSIGQWWDMIPATVQSVFLLQLRNLDQNSPVLLLATSDSSYADLPEQVSLRVNAGYKNCRILRLRCCSISVAHGFTRWSLLISERSDVCFKPRSLARYIPEGGLQKDA